MNIHTELLWRCSLLAVALVVLPVAYLRYARRLKHAGASPQLRLSFFAVFGNLGGWLLCFALLPMFLGGLFVAFQFYVTFPVCLFCLVWLLFVHSSASATRTAALRALSIAVVVSCVGFACFFLGWPF